MSKDNHEVALECGEGWRSLIDPIVQRINETDGTVQQIKEKYGRLRIDYEAGPDELDDSIQREIDEAERKSAKICELCGEPAVLMFKNSWYKTLCGTHSIELGYRERA